jgi:hypothetical protein
MRLRKLVSILAVAGGLFYLNAGADWALGDPFKMHYPQLPDPTGWDVKVSQDNLVADDFLCTESGPITGIHFWGSWKGDLSGTNPGFLQNIHLSIHSDNPEGPNGYSEPFELLWEYNTFEHDPSLVTWRVDGNGDQGWFDPLEQLILPGDHNEIWQYNIVIEEPFRFFQEKDTIYWLDIHVITEEGSLEFGWKTSLDHFNDDSVIDDFYGTLPVGQWIELIDPLTGVSMDQAFVIVPELPMVSLWTGMAALGLLLIRRHRRKG